MNTVTVPTLDEQTIVCPYCGEGFVTLIDCSLATDGYEVHSYVEDCEVCCQPILLQVSIVGEDIQVSAERENA